MRSQVALEWVDLAVYGGTRIGKPLLFLKDPDEKIGGGYGRPIYGVTPVVDLNAKKVIAVEDIGLGCCLCSG